MFLPNIFTISGVAVVSMHSMHCGSVLLRLMTKMIRELSDSGGAVNIIVMISIISKSEMLSTMSNHGGRLTGVSVGQLQKKSNSSIIPLSGSISALLLRAECS